MRYKEETGGCAARLASALAVVILVGLEGTTLTVARAGDRPVLGGLLAGANAAFAVLLLAWHGHHASARRVLRPPAEEEGEEWFSAEALEGFPMEDVRPLLLGPDAPSLNRLYVAWIFATHGYDAPWIARHLDLRLSVARLLENAAHCRG